MLRNQKDIGKDHHHFQTKIKKQIQEVIFNINDVYKTKKINPECQMKY